MTSGLWAQHASSAPSRNIWSSLTTFQVELSNTSLQKTQTVQTSRIMFFLFLNPENYAFLAGARRRAGAGGGASEAAGGDGEESAVTAGLGK